MRLTTLQTLVVVGVLAGCPAVDVSLSTPLDRFYFPTALTHLDNPNGVDGGAGLLVVASTNFDKRFSGGSLIAINLDTLSPPLPAFGAAPTSPVTQIPSIRPGSLVGFGDGGFPDAVLIAPFAGQMAALPTGAGSFRLFVPTRSEKQRVHSVDLKIGADGTPSLSCFGSSSRDCSTNATSLNTFEQTTEGVPRAPGAFGVSVRERVCTATNDCGESGDAGSYGCVAGACTFTPTGGSVEPAADVLVTHIAQADRPLGSAKDMRGYLVKLPSERLAISPEAFVNLGPGASHAVAVGRRWNYLSGRVLNPLGNLIRMVDLKSGAVLSSGIENTFRVAESRAIGLSADERRVYLLGRTPDALLVAGVDDPSSDSPTLSIIRGNPLPEAPNELAVLHRPGRGDLLAITCTNAGVLALYDDDVGDIVAQVPGLGVQPFGLAVDRRGAGARFFVSNFQDGRIAVVDLVDLEHPQNARLVAHIGRQQLCLVRPTDVSCTTDGGVPDGGAR